MKNEHLPKHALSRGGKSLTICDTFYVVVVVVDVVVVVVLVVFVVPSE